MYVLEHAKYLKVELKTRIWLFEGPEKLTPFKMLGSSITTHRDWNWTREKCLKETFFINLLVLLIIWYNFDNLTTFLKRLEVFAEGNSNLVDYQGPKG